MKPRLLDLFCGAGGCTKGYQDAGFYVVGVDNRPQPNYCGDEFLCVDVLELGVEFITEGNFSAVHASPPCQAYTTMNNRHASSSPPLITETRKLLVESGLPYVIENVPGAKKWLVSPFLVTGAMVGIKAMRPRLFETSFPVMLPPPNVSPSETVAVYGKNDGRRLWTRTDGSELRVASLEVGREGMGIDWMDWDELKEAIPPTFTALIGHQLMAHLQAVAA